MRFLTLIVFIYAFKIGHSVNPITSYNFYSNFGKVFYDLSGNNFNAENCLPAGGNAGCTYPTDRGAYFDQNSVIITQTKTLTEISFYMWIKLLNGQGIIYARKLNSPSLVYSYSTNNSFVINVIFNNHINTDFDQ